MQDTVKLFIGTSDNHDDLAQKVYLYTLFKNASMPIDIVFLRPKDFPGWNRKLGELLLLVIDMQYHI